MQHAHRHIVYVCTYITVHLDTPNWAEARENWKLKTAQSVLMVRTVGTEPRAARAVIGLGCPNRMNVRPDNRSIFPGIDLRGEIMRSAVAGKVETPSPRSNTSASPSASLLNGSSGASMHPVGFSRVAGGRAGQGRS